MGGLAHRYLIDSPMASAPPIYWRRSGLRCCTGKQVAHAAARVPLWKGRLREESAQARAANLRDLAWALRPWEGRGEGPGRVDMEGIHGWGVSQGR